jgi:glucose 1-dehydrogenase
MRGLAGKRVLVTGGATGIGRATALRFAREGASVAINFIGDPSPAEDVVEELLLANPDGGHVLAPADIADEDQVDELFADAIDSLGGLDVLVSNAGIKIVHEPHEATVAEFDRIMAVNFRGAFLCCQAAIQHFLDQGKPGAIVQTASVQGILPVETSAIAYIMSKSGLDGMIRTLALRYAREGIRVNAIAPGAIHTPMNANFKEDPALEAAMARIIPAGRVGEADEMAAVIAFLASDDASYIHGQTIVADGGLSAGRYG